MGAAGRAARLPVLLAAAAGSGALGLAVWAGAGDGERRPVLLAANAVGGGRLDRLQHARAPAELAPAACRRLGVTALVTGRGDVRAPSSSGTLILGSAGADKLRGDSGDDCLVGGAGQNEFRGEGGYDVCIGPADRPDRYESCEVVLP